MEILARSVGRRKEAVAQVILMKGTGNFIINNMAAQQYLHNNTYCMLSIKAPLNTLNMSISTSITDNVTIKTKSIQNTENSNETNLTDSGNNAYEVSSPNLMNLQLTIDKIDTVVKVKGGGLIGQTEAIKLGVARALCCLKTDQINISEEEIRKQLKHKGYLTQDSRIKERRKYGLKKARKATQYNKR